MLFRSSNSQYAYFDDCAFEADGSHQLPFSVGTTGITYNNCKFFQDSSAQCYTNGVFTGYTLFEFAGPYDATSNENYGRFVLNGTQLASTIPVTKAVNLVSYNGVISSVTRVANYVDGPTWAATVGGAVIGDVVFNANAASGGPAGWMCTAAGNPGTWKAMANLA